MKLSLVKIFPLSCEQMGYDEILINTEDIINIERDIKIIPHNDVIHTVDRTYVLPSLDNGLEILSMILIDEKLISLFEKNKMETTDDSIPQSISEAYKRYKQYSKLYT